MGIDEATRDHRRAPHQGGFASTHHPFGSLAAGTSTRDSDIDLLVVEDEVDDVRAEKRGLRMALGDLGRPLDVLVIRTERFEKTEDVIGGIAYPANRYGVVLYEAV